MIQFGARRGCAEEMNVFQSWRDLGEKSLVPSGQLLLSCVRRMSKQFTHFTTGPGEYGPFNVKRSHLHVLGLPTAGFVAISATPVHSLASTLPTVDVQAIHTFH